MIDSSSTLVEIGARLKQERERSGMNQSDFGVVGGVKRGSQLEYESGKRPFDIQYLLRLTEVGVDGYFILTGKRQAPSHDERSAHLLRAFAAMGPVDQAAMLRLACTLGGWRHLPPLLAFRAQPR
ncbi:helix-turn-helix transcriptional regulator [Sphingomonas sp. H160509]|uniref:helix-turn-helix domain-containing protein n=1 Tax=Sphingomonas sp. H160509 TaxID=2955313 RepID=UPI002097E08D|nr:helix-turn-helix transcriptional regulator [Sphingomonas sp. H160509]MDD1450844.1 helix-turn-helix transcriptional regulator [Sphingomonas sp. H160509]